MQCFGMCSMARTICPADRTGSKPTHSAQNLPYLVKWIVPTALKGMWAALPRIKIRGNPGQSEAIRGYKTGYA